MNFFFYFEFFIKKTLYAIEFLIKNHAKYFKYFQIHKNILNNLIMPKDENQASQAAVINNKIIAILENQTKNEKVYHDKLMIEVLIFINFIKLFLKLRILP